MSSIIKVGKVQSSTGQDAVTIANDGSISGLTTNNIQPASGQALTIKDEGGTASITVATNGEATFAENIKITNGKGVDFNAVSGSAGGSASAVLDDYEEGTWTIDVQGSGNAGTDNVGTGFMCHYTKIGRQVTVTFGFNLSSLTGYSGSTLKFKGLPFNSMSSFETAGNVMFHSLDIHDGKPQVTPYIGGDYDFFYLYQSSDSSSWQLIPDDTSFSLIGYLTYFTS